MKCARCQSEIHETDKFCPTCGYPLGSGAADSETQAEPARAYTPKFLIKRVLTTHDAIEGERKTVTVLLTDAADSTAWGDVLDPEEIHRIMDGCFRILMDVIHAYGGTVNQFRGDGLMALFGAPSALEDHACRACHAALEIQSTLHDYARDLQVRYGILFKMRIGLNSGTVVVGSIGDDLRADYTADGDTTNLAARMEALAAPGTTLVTRNTYLQARERFEFKPLGKTVVKGKKAPLPIYELKGRRPLPSLRGDREIHSDLVGRDDELRLLQDRTRSASADHGSIINLIGEAGIGKSRLIAEYRKVLNSKDITLLQGRALHIGRNLSFHPLIDALRGWAGILHEETDAESLQKLEGLVHRISPEGDLEGVVPFLATFMGLQLSALHAECVRGVDGEALEKLILKAIRDLFVRAGRNRTLVLVLEDLQWADQSTLEFLESLWPLAENHSIVFIHVLRPAYRKTSNRLLKVTHERYDRLTQNIFLTPLSQEQGVLLLRNLMTGRTLPSSVEQRLIRLTEGNPFFMEEILRAFLDRGVIQARSGGFSVTDLINTVTVPDRIQDVLAERIDRLDESCKNLLKVASVIGRGFFHAILARTLGTAEGFLPCIEQLKEKQFILERERMGEVEYRFKHGLLQEAAYESILLQKRKDLHLAVAEATKTVFSDRLHAFYGILAYHYGKAEDLQNAETFLLKAAEEASRSSASNEALTYYQEALELYLELSRFADGPKPQKVAMLEKNIGLALFHKGRYGQALAYLDRVLERRGFRPSKARTVLNPSLGLHLLSLVRTIRRPHRDPGRPPTERDRENFDLMEKRLICLAYLDPKRYFIEFLSSLHWARDIDIRGIPSGPSRYSGASALFSWTGFSFPLSRRILEYTKPMIRREDFRERLDHILFSLYYDYFTGNWKTHETFDEDLLERNLAVGRFWHVSTYLFFICAIRIGQGRFEPAHALMNRLVEILDTYENENTREYVHSLRLHEAIKARRLADAEAFAEEAIAFARESNREPALFHYMGNQAVIQILGRRLPEARRSLDRAEEILGRQYIRIPYYLSGFLRGRFLLDIVEWEDTALSGRRSPGWFKARRTAQRGRQAWRNSRKNADQRPEIFRLLGVLAWLRGRQHAAIAWWEKSLAEGLRLASRIETARTYLEIGKWLARRDSRMDTFNGLEPRFCVEKAQTFLEETGLAWDVENGYEAASNPPRVVSKNGERASQEGA
jgi:class 3 adenylate cyclase/tetratricopeptide (TPR) repeat protein